MRQRDGGLHPVTGAEFEPLALNLLSQLAEQRVGRALAAGGVHLRRLQLSFQLIDFVIESHSPLSYF